MEKIRQPIVVIGAGDHAKVVISSIQAADEYTMVNLLDDDKSKHNTHWYGQPVLGGSDRLKELHRQGCRGFVVAVGDNQARADLQLFATEVGLRPITVIHPTAVVLDGSKIGEGSVLLPHAYVGADARIGKGCLLSVGAMVAHDCILGDWCQLCPGAKLGGHVRVGDYSLIGMGASVLPRVTVGRKVMVGASAAVIGDVPDFATAVGVPFRLTTTRWGGNDSVIAPRLPIRQARAPDWTISIHDPQGHGSGPLHGWRATPNLRGNVGRLTDRMLSPYKRIIGNMLPNLHYSKIRRVASDGQEIPCLGDLS